MAILGASKHPVLIKKISLNIWLLRDEVEAIIAKRLELSDGDPSAIKLDELAKEYSFTLQAQSLAQKNIDASEDGQLDDSEDAMAAALAEAAEEESSENESDDTEDKDNTTNESDESSTIDENTPQYVEQRKPLLPPEKIIKGSSFLAEINIDEMFFFAAREFIIGQSIVIEFDIPRNFMINATVFYCRPYNMKSRIISHNPLPYRVGVKFSLSKAGERSLLRDFLRSIEPDLEAFNTSAPAESSNEDDEDDILDGLDDDF